MSDGAVLPCVVLDTGIVLAAAFNPVGVAMQTVRCMERGEIRVVMSNRLRAEYEAILAHPAHQTRFAHITGEYVALQLDRLDNHAERVPNPPIVVPYPRDVNDEPIVNLLIAANADFLVTLDKDMIALPDYPPFAERMPRIQILRPGAFLTEMERRRE
ncbi:MAG: putative toxin-antitoxin system toxin component, PIN family [Armatimonadetes bacterium]|nr:putative toxin-antitoxin system toxin component, PIN family [Armatimonadota bacterium]